MSHWKPNLNLIRTNSELIVLVELAGISRGCLELSIDGQILLVSGRREDPLSKERRSHLVDEVAFGEFLAEVEVPAEYDLNSAHAVYQNGFLRIDIPALLMGGGRGRRGMDRGPRGGME